MKVTKFQNKIYVFKNKISQIKHLVKNCIATKRSIIPELQNRDTDYDVINRVTNSKFFFLIFRVSNSM